MACLQLNVGGVAYSTSSMTLSTYPDSMLARMVNGDLPTARDENGAIFIDRDGHLFRYVLNFLRSGQLHLPDSASEKEQLLIEADFYQITPLVDALQKPTLADTSQKALKNGWLVELHGSPMGVTFVSAKIDFLLRCVSKDSHKRKPFFDVLSDRNEFFQLGKMKKEGKGCELKCVGSRLECGNILLSKGSKLLGSHSEGGHIYDKWLVPSDAFNEEDQHFREEVNKYLRMMTEVSREEAGTQPGPSIFFPRHYGPHGPFG